MFITDADGNVYNLKNDLVNMDDYEDITFPGTVAYAKHSRLFYIYIPSAAATEDNDRY